MTKILYVVHCIDTEGPLTEDLTATFNRLHNLFNIKLEPTEINLLKIQKGEIEHPKKKEIMKVFSEELLKYNNSWSDISVMLDDCMSSKFRNKYRDDFGGGWVYSWHCMDHAGYSDNPRRKDIGFGNVFNFYSQKIRDLRATNDEINWHFHPLAFDRNPLKAATSYNNSMSILLDIISRRIINNKWFPTTNRPGFHSERPDSHLFMEQWIPFDYANQQYGFDDGQADLVGGRFGDWRRASSSWRGYHPCHNDYQSEGNCNRKIFRCLNVGTRFNILQKNHVIEALDEASVNGKAILSFADHDYRDIRPDIDYVYDLLMKCKSEYPDVKIKFIGANAAARELNNVLFDKIELDIELLDNRLKVKVISGSLFGPQPFLAIKTKCNNYYHDNFDVIDFGKEYSYIFDDQTISLDAIESIGVASADINGYFDVKVMEL